MDLQLAFYPVRAYDLAVHLKYVDLTGKPGRAARQG